jgi:Ca-activated chloride channel family protein
MVSPLLAAISIHPGAILGIAAGAALIVLLAEWLHTRRVRRIGYLAFGPSGAPRTWVRSVPFVRAAALACAVWGMTTLLTIDGRPAEDRKQKEPDRHLLLALDVSPSMYLKDAGPGGTQTRQERAAEIMQSVLARLDMRRTKVTVVAFYSSARPVVTDTTDIAVVNNILRDLPLSHAFKEGQTDMFSGVRQAAKVAEKWRPGSATLLVVSDGDTLPEVDPVRLPKSIADTLVVGVGNPYLGSPIAGRSSRQDIGALKQLAAKVRGRYHDGNASQIASTTLSSLSMLSLKDDESVPLRTIALALTGVGSTIFAGLPAALALWGAPQPRRRPEAKSDAKARTQIESKPSSVAVLTGAST